MRTARQHHRTQNDDSIPQHLRFTPAPLAMPQTSSNCPMLTTFLIWLLVAVLYLLHQDYWNWLEYEPLAFGFLPIGLSYHVGYSCAAAAVMALLVRYCWPSHLEDAPEATEEEPS